MKLFHDRKDAGRKLAEALQHKASHPGVIVLGLPRGGVVVAYEVAHRLQCLLDIFMVRKVGVPGHEELAMGAIASGGICVFNHAVIGSYRLPEATVDAAARFEKKELDRNEKLYRGSRPLTHIEGREVILVDDGLATGSTMDAAVTALKKQNPANVTVAVPVASVPACDLFRDKVGEVICLHKPDPFYAVGTWYESFEQTSDEEVQQLLWKSREGRFLNGEYEGQESQLHMRKAR